MLILASASPRRREMLERVGISVTVMPADIDEQEHPREAPGDYVMRVARSKAIALGQRLVDEQRPVLAADTTVTINGNILGKPTDGVDAARMLHQLSGRTHHVLTAFALYRGGVSVTEQVVITDVQFVPLSAAWVSGYVASGEWRGKAGGYALQGIAAAMVSAVHGSVTNVIGLPLAEVLIALQAVGVPAQFANGIPQ
jgi:septum formation protein